MKDAQRVVMDLIADHPGCQIDDLVAMFPKEQYLSAHVPTIVDHLNERRQIVIANIRIPGQFRDEYRRYFFPLGTVLIL